jgi:nucleoside 2-deoxyribosyltransferase
MKTVYLCGGINKLSDADAKDWREQAKAVLFAAGFTVLDPMRRDFRGIEGDHTAAIVQGDLFDIGACDVLLVNASRPSWGTAMEVMYAARCIAHRKTIVAFGAGEQPSPWLAYHCDRLCPDLASALAHLTAGAV